jgi:hypothetical protein
MLQTPVELDLTRDLLLVVRLRDSGFVDNLPRVHSAVVEIYQFVDTSEAALARKEINYITTFLSTSQTTNSWGRNATLCFQEKNPDCIDNYVGE